MESIRVCRESSFHCVGSLHGWPLRKSESSISRVRRRLCADFATHCSRPRSAGNAAAMVFDAAVNVFVQSSRSSLPCCYSPPIRQPCGAARTKKSTTATPWQSSRAAAYRRWTSRGRSASDFAGVCRRAALLFLRLDASSAVVRRIVNESHISASAPGTTAHNDPRSSAARRRGHRRQVRLHVGSVKPRRCGPEALKLHSAALRQQAGRRQKRTVGASMIRKVE